MDRRNLRFFVLFEDFAFFQCLGLHPDVEKTKHELRLCIDKIVEYQVGRAPDRREAIREVLEMEDAEAFLEQSGYREKFSR